MFILESTRNEYDKCFESSKFKDCYELALKIIELSPCHMGGYNRAGISLMRMKETKKAEFYFLKALSFNNSDETSLRFLSRINRDKGDFELSSFYIDCLVSNNKKMLGEKILNCIHFNKFDEAKKLILEAEDINISNLDKLKKMYNNKINISISRKSMMQEVISGSLKQKFIDYDRINKKISDIIIENKPFLIGRVGRTEGLILDNWINNIGYSEDIMDFGQNNAGVTPKTKEVFDYFSECYFNAAKDVDLLGLVGYEKQLELVTITKNNLVTMNNFFSPIDINIHNGVDISSSWTLALKGKKVLVIHPFAESIEKQYKRIKSIDFLSGIIPDFELMTLKPPQTSAGNHGSSNFINELNYLQDKVSKMEFDIALIGAGAYGLPIGSYVKSKGHVAIVIGGVVQTLFGIIGGRWEDLYKNNDVIGKNWIRPSLSETPIGASRVENSCYW